MTDERRVRTDGGRLRCADQPVRVRGVTYGPFHRRPRDARFPEPAEMSSDLRALRRLGINAIRISELPTVELLDLAGEHGVRVLAGLRFHDWRMEAGAGPAARRRIVSAGHRAVDEALELVAGRPEVLAVAVAEEVPVELVRLHHRHHVEQTLASLIARLHAGDPGLLATYVNSPTTDYLHIPNQDLVTFNVSRTTSGTFDTYLEHLRTISSGQPVLVTDVGRAAAVKGPVTRAAYLCERLRAVDEHGVAGAFVFAWTNEWVVSGDPVTGWHFDVTRDDRVREPAARVVPGCAELVPPGSPTLAWARSA